MHKVRLVLQVQALQTIHKKLFVQEPSRIVIVIIDKKRSENVGKKGLGGPWRGSKRGPKGVQKGSGRGLGGVWAALGGQERVPDDFYSIFVFF